MSFTSMNSLTSKAAKRFAAQAMLFGVLVSFGVNAASAVTIAIDVNDEDDVVSTTDFTDLNALHGAGDSPVVIDGITFQTLGALGARERNLGGGSNTLTTDFIFADGAIGAVAKLGMRLGVPSATDAGTLAAGTWRVEVWSFDTVTAGLETIGYETLTGGVPQPDTILSTSVAWNNSAPAYTFDLEADGVSYYSVFLYGNDDGNNDFSDGANRRGRFNGIRLTQVPEPTSIALVGLGLVGLGVTRRLRK